MPSGKPKNAIIIAFVSAGILACFAIGYVLMRGNPEEAPPPSTTPATVAATTPVEKTTPSQIAYATDFSNAPGDEWNLHPPPNPPPPLMGEVGRGPIPRRGPLP